MDKPLIDNTSGIFKNWGRCFECDVLTIHIHEHHVIPKSVGGTKTVKLCDICHGKVHDRSFLNHRRLTKMGQDRARANGAKVGRPKKLTQETDSKILTALLEGSTPTDIAKIFGVSPSYISRLKNNKLTV